MTANELQRIATRVGNSCHCRHWLNFYNSQSPVHMAIQALEFKGSAFYPVEVKELLKLGFKICPDTKPISPFIYIIKRTNEDGSDFVSEIF